MSRKRTLIAIATVLMAIAAIALFAGQNQPNGEGKQTGNGACAMQSCFVDKNGDGTCDRKQDRTCTGQQVRKRDRVRCCEGTGQGPRRNFIDQNKDGVCDRFVDQNNDGCCDRAHQKKKQCRQGS